MSNLLETYESMKANADITKEAEAVENERVETLEKYATVADNLLAEEYGNDYNENDVVELAHSLINNDLQQEEAQEKVAEYAEAGAVMARAFLAELSQE